MRNQSGVQRLIYCEEHDMYRVDCSHVHEARAVKEPIEKEEYISFNDGNNLTIIKLRLKLERGRVYFLNEGGKWERFRVKLVEQRGMIE